MEPPKIRWHDEYYKWTQQFCFEAAKSQLNYLCLHDAVVYSCFAFGWIKQNSLMRHKKIVCLTLVIFLIKIYIYILKKLIVRVCFGFVLFCFVYFIYFCFRTLFQTMMALSLKLKMPISTLVDLQLRYSQNLAKFSFL